MQDKTGVIAWARNEFGATDLGDVRRTRRLVAMAIGAAKRPSGKVSSVFDRSREREGAYDFLESPHVDADAVAASVFDATLRRACGQKTVFVSIDGSSLSLTDETGTKGFGPVGSPNCPVTGLMMMNALAVTRDGVPLGLIDQLWWNRAPTRDKTRREKFLENAKKPFDEKEPAYVLRAAQNAIDRFAAQETRVWVVIDREADNGDILRGLIEADCIFTVRGGRYDRRVLDDDAEHIYELLDREPSLGTYEVEAKRRGGAKKKTVVDVRATQVTLLISPYADRPACGLRLWAIRLRDASGAPDGPDWLLYTNVPVLSMEHARGIIASYETRWRVEEFHRTWKQGQCNVEDAQLHSEQAVIVWATILAAIATRIERLKYLSRRTPDEPATIEFQPEEIEVLKLDQKRRWTKRKRIPKNPTIAQTTGWLAELGGWIGPGNGPPGSTTLARGLERLGYLVEGFLLARQVAAVRSRT
jgi:hypothetical protein